MVSVFFLRPWYLFFLVLIPIIIWAHFMSLKVVKGKVLKLANFEAIENMPINKLISKKYGLLIFKVLIILMLVLSVAGMKINYLGKFGGSNFVLAIDTSSSMSIEDYTPNRLDAAKRSAIVFIERVSGSSKIGVLSFAGGSFIRAQLTTDKSRLKSAIENLEFSRTGGTDIGGVIINSVNLLMMEKEGIKSIILITDGQSNVGSSVGDGIEYANENSVVVHVIGIGTLEGGTLENTEAILKLDEDTLQEIADKTDGQYHKVESTKEMERIYSEFADLGRGKVEINLVPYLLMFILILLVIMWGVLSIWFGVVP